MRQTTEVWINFCVQLIFIPYYYRLYTELFSLRCGFSGMAPAPPHGGRENVEETLTHSVPAIYTKVGVVTSWFCLYRIFCEGCSILNS